MSGYGLAWKGSKNFIADWVVDNLPSADCFIDLFFGGGAITHCAMTRNKYKTYIANDLLDTTSLFIDCVNGAISKDPKYLEWVSKEDFKKRKTTELWVAIVYSFGNHCRNYMYSKELEPYKKAVHYAIVYNDFSLLDEYSPLFRDKIKGDTWQERRLSLRGVFDDKQIIKSAKRTNELVLKFYKNEASNKRNGLVAKKREILDFLKQKYSEDSLQSLQSLERLERLERLQSLQSLERLQSLQDNKNLTRFITTQKDYREYNSENIPKNSVVYCFDKDTEILTKRGWINVSECTLDDLCLSRNPDTEQLEWVKVVNLISYHHKGKMYKYVGKNVDLLVTPNHRMYMSEFVGRNRERKNVFIEAEKLFNSSNYRYNFVSSGGKWQGDDNSIITVCDTDFDKKDFAYFLGLFVTDGSVNNQGAITIMQSKTRVVEKLKDCLDRLKLEYSIYETKNGGKQFYIARKYLPFFNQFYLKENRKLPQDIKDWGVEYLQKLLEGMLDGDGSENRRICLGSKPLVDDIQEICYKLGLSSCYKVIKPKTTFYEKENRFIVGTKNYYQISINRKPYLSVVKNNQSLVDYDDIVNCITLEKWHTVLIRRNGKCIWCGQCDPPYYNTDEYTTTDGNKNAFDNKELWAWIVETQNKRPDCLFVMSEYYAPDDFVCVGEKEKRVLLNNAGIETGGRAKAMERLFVVKSQYENWKKRVNKGKGLLFY